MEINPYIGLAINGFCTGTGVVVAQHIYELYIKKKVEKVHKITEKAKDIIKEEYNKNEENYI